MSSLWFTQVSEFMECMVLFVNGSRITVFLVPDRDHNLKSTSAQPFRHLTKRNMEDGQEEMQSSIWPYDLKSISGLREIFREWPNQTPHCAPHNCFPLHCASAVMLNYSLCRPRGNHVLLKHECSKQLFVVCAFLLLVIFSAFYMPTTSSTSNLSSTLISA